MSSSTFDPATVSLVDLDEPTPLARCLAELTLTARDCGGDADDNLNSGWFGFTTWDEACRFRELATIIGGRFGFDTETNHYSRGYQLQFKVIVKLRTLTETLVHIALAREVL